MDRSTSLDLSLYDYDPKVRREMCGCDRPECPLSALRRRPMMAIHRVMKPHGLCDLNGYCWIGFDDDDEDDVEKGLFVVLELLHFFGCGYLPDV